MNDGIDVDLFRVVVPQHKEYAELCLLYGALCWLIGEDLAEAFYQLPSAQRDSSLLITQLCGRRMSPNSLGMGLRPSAFYCDGTSHLLGEFYNYEIKGDYPELVDNFKIYYDDFLFGASRLSDLIATNDIFHGVVNKVGMKLNDDKKLGPTRIIKVQGLIWNMYLMNVSVGVDKIDWLIDAIEKTLEVGIIQVSAFHTIVGKLMNIATLSPVLKPLIFSSIVFLYKATGGFTYNKFINNRIKKKFLHLHDIIKLHFRCILAILKMGIPSIPIHIIAHPGFDDVTHRIHGWCDASSTGFGYVTREFYFSGNNNNDSPIHINEALASLHLINAMVNHYDLEPYNVVLTIHTDSLPLFYAAISKWSKDYILITILYEIYYLCHVHQVYVFFHYIHTSKNVLADSLSRARFDDFSHWCRYLGFDNTARLTSHATKDNFIFSV